MASLTFVIALAVAAGVTPLLIRLGGKGFLVDRPNERSSHKQPTPRGGGVAIVFAVAVAAGIGARSAPAWIVLGAALAMAGLGFLDDAFHLPVLPRLIAQLACAGWVAWIIGPVTALSIPGLIRIPFGVLAIPATVIWIVGVTNFFNFMDGIDGLAAGQAVLSSIVVLLAGWSADASIFALAIAGGAIGFLIYNWSPARIFMGDAGSMLLGFLLPALPLLAPAERRPDAAFATAIGLALFLLDPTVTLARRLVCGERIGISHRDHAYQQFVRVGELHGRATATLLFVTAPLALLGAWAYRDSRFGIAAAVAAVVVYAVEATLAGVIRRQKPLSSPSA